MVQSLRVAVDDTTAFLARMFTSYGTSRVLCTPAYREKPEPADCGSHHILRIHLCWLTIMRLPMKSITSGLTCVAAYIAPECEKGRNSGFASVPYPREIARRVDHASNVAAPLPVIASAYHNFRCLGVSVGRVIDILTPLIGAAG